MAPEPLVIQRTGSSPVSRYSCLHSHSHEVHGTVTRPLRPSQDALLPSNHEDTERTTLFYANSQYPDQAVKTLAIAARTEQDFLDTPIPPCGACRQVLLETEKRFGKPMRILLYSKSDIYIMEGVSALLPLSFDGDYLTTN